MNNVIVGNKEYALLVADYMQEAGISVSAFVVDEEYIDSDTINNIPVFSWEKLISEYPSKEICLYLGVGYSKNGSIRQALYEKAKKKGYCFENYIHETAQIAKNVDIGEGNIIFENVVVQRNTKIGNGNLLFANTTIMHDNKIGNFNTFCACSVSNGIVTIGDCNLIGSNATLKDKISVGNRNVIGAGVYIRTNCPDQMIVRPVEPVWSKT